MPIDCKIATNGTIIIPEDKYESIIFNPSKPETGSSWSISSTVTLGNDGIGSEIAEIVVGVIQSVELLFQLSVMFSFGVS